MATITAGQSGSFTLDAFGYITVVASGDGTLTGSSRASNLKSNVSISKLASVQYGPYGVPMDFVIACTNGTITYTVTEGYYPEQAGTGSSTSGGGGGSDRTAVTYEVDPVNGGYRVLTETVAGFPWTLSYDAQGRLITRTITGSSVAATISYDAAGFGTATGNYMLNDGVVATLAQMRALQALIIAGTVSGVSNGARVFVTDVGYYNDVANSSDTIGAWCRWEGDQFAWEKPVVYMNDYASTYAPNNTSLSGALNAVSIPAGIMGKRSVAKIAFRIERVGGATSTMSSFIYLNGSSMYQTGALAATSLWTQVRKSLWNMGVLNAQQTENLASSDVATSSSTAMHTRSIDTSSTALDFDVRVQFGGTDAADNAKVWRLCVVVSDDFVMA